MPAVHGNMFDASVDADRQNGDGGAQIVALPLNLIARIVSWIEDPGDLARMCRTCRVFNYMAIPHLYRNISLTSYDRIRYRDEQPEGWGNASPFSMGLNTLVTRAHASLVQSMTLRGDWNEPDLEEHSRVGRVPDSSMMLNITVRAALDRTRNIESFSWELNTKLLETVYQGLVQLPKLTSLSIRFPTSRHPRPIYAIPAMPHLRSLKVTDIDPLCYPDDISTILAKSPHLQDLVMHWSPRMRETQEPSVTFHDYFRHCVGKSPLKLKKISFYNLYARNSNEWKETVDETSIEEMTFLNGFDSQDPFRNLTFVDQTWAGFRPHGQDRSKLKVVRTDTINKDTCEFLTSFSGLEKWYFVNSTTSTQLTGYRQNVRQLPGGTPLNLAATPSYQVMNNSTVTGNSSAVTPSSPRSPASGITQIIQLRDIYFNTILSNHGATLRHLVLPSLWPLSVSALARLVHVCPNIEQLAFAPEISTLEVFSLLIPFLRNLRALRVLVGPSTSEARVQPSQNPTMPFASTISEVVELDAELHAEKLSVVTADKKRAAHIKIIGMGWRAWELGEFFYIPVPDPVQPAEDALQVVNTSTSSQESPTTDSSVSELSRVGQRHNLRLKDAPIPPTASQMPPSSLGKRARDGSVTPAGSPNRPSLVLDSDYLYDTLPSGETIMWRRRVRPVNPETLKKWEIWALDSRDI